MKAGLLLALLALAPPAAASSEYKAKAAFLFNFGKFVQWPEAALAGGELRLCVFDDAPFGGALDALEGRQVRGQRLVVVRGPKLVPARCHILFVGRGADASALLRELGRTPVLTVGEIEGFAERGGILNFKIVDGKIRLEINPEAAKQAGLRVSARLLKLATVVPSPS